jgi:type IV pilus assembly protein PilP
MTSDLRLVALTGLLGLAMAADAPAQTAAPAATAPESGTPATGIVEQPPVPGGYVYNPSGRRDPFMSLVRRGGPTEKGARPSGVEGLLIAEMALRGILKNMEETEQYYIAFLSGPDGKSYWVRTGQRVFDGRLVAIDATTVTFEQEVSDPLSRVKTRNVKKYLYPSEEATQ